MSNTRNGAVSGPEAAGASELTLPATPAGSSAAEKTAAVWPRPALDQALAERLVAEARHGGSSLVGPDGLLSGIVAQLLETALEVEFERASGP